MVAVNVAAVADLASRFVPGMVERGRGAVLNVASTAAFQPMPGTANYAATKAYVLSLSEALHAELKGEGVTVTALCPGPVKTEFAEVAGIGDTEERTPDMLWTTAEEVAADAVRGARARASASSSPACSTAPARSAASTRRAPWRCRS